MIPSVKQVTNSYFFSLVDADGRFRIYRPAKHNHHNPSSRSRLAEEGPLSAGVRKCRAMVQPVLENMGVALLALSTIESKFGILHGVLQSLGLARGIRKIVQLASLC